MKLGLWLVVAVVVFLWFNHAKKQRKRQKDRGASTPSDAAAGSGPAPGSVPTPAVPVIEHIVACHHCGLHVPVSDAIETRAGKRFCSEAHRGLHPEA